MMGSGYSSKVEYEPARDTCRGREGHSADRLDSPMMLGFVAVCL